jgi:predicted nuclease of predicted toxin-antitoxin system
VPLSLYLDDCAYSHTLADLLREGGHRVIVPADVGLGGADDDVHLRHATENRLILVTKNPADFLDLHEQTAGSHAGVLAIYQDNDVTRDMPDTEIAGVITFLEAFFGQHNLAFAGNFHVVNQWRGMMRQATSPTPPTVPPAPDAPTSRKSKRARKKK